MSIENGGTATLGLIYIASGLGTGFGPLLMRRWLGDSRKRLMAGITIGFSLLAIGILMLGFVTSLPAFLIATFIRTFGPGTIWVFSAVILQVMVPDKVKGRVFAFEFAALTLTESISVLAAGYFQDTFAWSLVKIAFIFGWLGWRFAAFGCFSFYSPEKDWIRTKMPDQKLLHRYDLSRLGREIGVWEG